jgi:DNA-binding NarL/FixJ family response regulator
VRIVALVGDLMDRSRISAAVPDATFATEPTGTQDADVVVIDLGRQAAAVPAVRRLRPDAWIVAFGSHVDEAVLATATDDGADRVLPRSRFFQDPAAAVAPGDRGVPA